MILSNPGKRRRRLRLPVIVALVVGCFAAAGYAAGADPVVPASDSTIWWLPHNYSEHGDDMDFLFNLIFWITTIVFVAVEGVLVVFLIKYRHRPEVRKAKFTHGNTRLEMVWTLLPAVILVVLALMTKGVWDRYRYSPHAADKDLASVLVVGEQFKWNIVYPGPDGKLGRYLVYPKPTDPKYRAMKYADAVKAINDWIQNKNPLGQDKTANKYADDDDYAHQPGRPIILPAGQPLEIVLSAKDVLHDFFLPNFRVKLDAVPGMRGIINFTAKEHSQSTEMFEVDNVPADRQVWLDQDTPYTELVGDPKHFQISDPNDKKKDKTAVVSTLENFHDAAQKRLVRAGAAAESITEQQINEEVVRLRADLKRIGITRLSVVTHPFELDCEELCGMGHYTMRADVIFVSKHEYENFLNKERKPATQPTGVAAGAAIDSAGPVIEAAVAGASGK